MIRMNYMVTQIQDKKLRAEAKKRAVSISEVLRNAIDDYFRKLPVKE
jgi:hypothetical protein